MTKQGIISGPFSDLPYSKTMLYTLILIVLTLSQSLAVIYLKSHKRINNAKISKLAKQQNNLNIEWSQLLLEQGTWQSEARVEQIARTKLGMVAPDNIKVITP